MHPLGPYDRRIELREPPFFHPFLKSFVLIAAIGAIGGGGYFLARSHLIDPSALTFRAGADRHVAGAATSYAAPDRENTATETLAKPTARQSSQASINDDQTAATYSQDAQPQSQSQPANQPQLQPDVSPLQGQVQGDRVKKFVTKG